MSNLIQLLQENQKLKYQLEKLKSSNGLLPYIDDSVIKGGYHVVKNITERDAIDCCYRKLGMKVLVIGEDFSFKEYVLKSNNCKENIWQKRNTITEEDNVTLVEDYSELGEDLSTQRDLNLVLKQILQNLQTQIDNIELTDEKVQITENTDFAQIGENQKIFNKNVSIYKNNNDLKNQEQDGRLENLEGINYTWSPTNRTLTLYDNNGNQLSQVSLVSLDNEGTDIRYNASTLSLELYNSDNELLDSIPVSSFIGSVGTQLQLNSNQLQLKDSQGNVLSTVSFSIINIQGLQTALDSRLNKGSYSGNASDLKTEIDSKLNKPTTTGTTTNYPFVVGEDGNGNSARLPAGDLGKNFFNSDLSNTTARNHTMNAGVTINTLGNPYSLTGLPNKNADIANFRKVRVQNTGGLDAVVDSKNLLIDGVTSMTDAEKNSFATAVNGGYSTSTMSIATILPLMIEIIDSVQYVTVLGNNLNVNPLNFSVLILDENNNTVANVSANSNVSSATQLIFWYNFKNFTAGKYKIKINNGVSSIISATTFDVVTSLTKTEINTSALIWKSNEYTGAIANGSGGNAAMTINNGGSITILKSNPIVNTSIGNFVLSMIGTCSFTSSYNDSVNVLSTLGVIFNGGTTIPTTETASKGILINSKSFGNINYTSIGLQTTANTSPNYTLSFEFIIQKINNTVIYLLIVNGNKVYSSYTILSTDFDISAIIKGYPMSLSGGNTSYSISGISGYTY